MMFACVIELAIINTAKGILDDRLHHAVNLLRPQIENEITEPGVHIGVVASHRGWLPSPKSWWLFLTDSMIIKDALSRFEFTPTGFPLDCVYINLEGLGPHPDPLVEPLLFGFLRMNSHKRMSLAMVSSLQQEFGGLVR